MAVKIPRVVTLNKDLDTFQTQLIKALQPITSNAILFGTPLLQISLASGANTFPHTLNRQQQGWFLTDGDASVTIYRSAPFNATNLTLTASAACVVNLWVY